MLIWLRRFPGDNVDKGMSVGWCVGDMQAEGQQQPVGEVGTHLGWHAGPVYLLLSRDKCNVASRGCAVRLVATEC